MAKPVHNAGSTARDHLANERTFLAWVRTGLGFIGLGVVLQKLIERGGTSTVALGFLFIVGGTVQLIYGLVRYRRIARLLVDGHYAPAQRGPAALVMFCCALALAAGVLMFL